MGGGGIWLKYVSSGEIRISPKMSSFPFKSLYYLAVVFLQTFLETNVVFIYFKTSFITLVK